MRESPSLAQRGPFSAAGSVLLVVPALGFTGAHHPIHGHMVASVRLLGMFAQVVFPVERLCQQ